MNAGLCPVHGHHIPLEPLCGVQQSGGEGRPGQDRTGEGRPGDKTLIRSSASNMTVKDACGSVTFTVLYVEEVIILLVNYKSGNGF